MDFACSWCGWPEEPKEDDYSAFKRATSDDEGPYPYPLSIWYQHERSETEASDMLARLSKDYDLWKAGDIDPSQLENLQAMPRDHAKGLLWWQWVEMKRGVETHDRD